jgi:hypothetical protein
VVRNLLRAATDPPCALVILHADRRPHDDFSGGALYAEWVTCLIGVTDLLDAGLEVGDRDERIAWELRQAQLNQHEDQVPSTAIHHEIYRVLWSELTDERAQEAEQAFLRATGLTIGDYFSVGACVMARLLAQGASAEGSPLVQPDAYFASTQLEAETWKAFFAWNARDLEGLRDELLNEDAHYGPTTYGSLAFERCCEILGQRAHLDRQRLVPQRLRLRGHQPQHRPPPR